MSHLFANPTIVAQSWYPAARSKAVPRRCVRSFELGNRRIAVYRDENGRVYAIDARCPHLGADLAQGTVEGDALRCAFHRWCFGPDGICRDAPGHRQAPERCARTYPTEERWGLVWIFNGPAPLFDLPSPEGSKRWRTLTLPPQRVGCHPHVVLANGLDLSHYEALHGMTFTEEPHLTEAAGPYEVSVELRGRPLSRFWQFVSGTRRREITARFTTIGGSLALSSVFSPIRFHVLFTGRPDRAGRCVTRTIFLFRTAPNAEWLRALGLMVTLLHHDRRVLDTIDFRPQFAETDEPLRAFANVVNALGAW
jgi:aminopyrrolnitrin oxygenase